MHFSGEGDKVGLIDIGDWRRYAEIGECSIGEWLYEDNGVL